MQKKSEGESKPPELMVELTEKLKHSFDVAQIPLHIDGKRATLFYLKTVVDGAQLQEVVIKPFFEMPSEQHFEAYVNSLPNKTEIPSKEELLILLTRGFVLLAIQDRFVLLDIRKTNSDTVQQAVMESTVHGPQLALSEDLDTNLNIIRQRYHASTLAIEVHELKDKSHRSIAILYDDKVVKTKVLTIIKKKILKLNMPLIQSAGDLQLHLNERKLTLFPITILSERPDRIVLNLTAGKVVLMVDGSPHAVIGPVVFFDFMVSMEDNYHAYWVSLFGTILGYLGLLTCLLLPGLYIAITSYAPEVFRTELALTVAGSRIGVPYPSFIEVIFMLFFMELLMESAIRLPKAISAAATTVGGLILGTAATEAALASNIMVIVVAAVAISTFVIPLTELSFAVRILRILLLVFTSIFGFTGLIVGFLGIILYLVNKESFGEPYFRMFWQNKKEEIR